MNILDSRAARVLMTVIVFAIGCLFVYLAWRTLIAFLFAIFFAYLLEGPISYFEKLFKGSRAKAILAVYAIMCATLGVVLLIAAPRAMQEAQHLSQQLPGLSQKLSSGDIAFQLGNRRGWSYETSSRIQQFLQGHREQTVGFVEGFLARAAAGVQQGWWLLLVPILAIFFLKDGTRLRDDMISLVRSQRKREVLGILVSELNEMLGHFMRAQLVLALLAMVVLTLGLWAMRVPYAFALGPIAGALEFIPVVGPIIGGAAVLVVAFAANYRHVIWVLVFLLIWRGIQDYFSSPRIMGGKLELHPLAVLFGVLAGGEIGGVIGVFISVPVLAAVRIAWRTWTQYRERQLHSALAAQPVVLTR